MPRARSRVLCRLGRTGAFLLLPALAGCPTAGVYRTARTLNKGQFDIGGYASSAYSERPGVPYTNSAGETVVTQARSGGPFFISPEVSAHYGIKDNVEVGCRLAFLALLAEVDLKLRLVGDRNATRHLAVAPAFGYAAPYSGLRDRSDFLLEMQRPRVTLPIIFTQDLKRNLALNLAAYGGFRQAALMTGAVVDFFVAGGDLGLEFRVPGGYFMPMIDVSRTQTRTVTASAGESQTSVIFGLALGAILGR